MVHGNYGAFCRIASMGVLGRILATHAQEQLRSVLPKALLGDLMCGLNRPNAIIWGVKLTDFGITLYIRGVKRN